MLAGVLRLVAGVGFEPHDLRVMSPTSYQAALPRDIVVPEAGVEPVRDCSHGILSPGRLPIPPLRHSRFPNCLKIIAQSKRVVNMLCDSLQFFYKISLQIRLDNYKNFFLEKQ